ncbi:hypothetical protein [Bacillus sp. EB600]|uniref:hypothetical protein n=1 Tax=Bacillus sp. EB600 TaxID=2806345 RepID=UPI0021095427|nr:hypothetical protein [Bacillus sp. EB600]MCQ6280016.1 hypothetical protein [Bacillus sp. EB600]
MNDDKIENMLSQLIKMVGNIQSEQQEMKLVQKDMHNKLQDIETRGEERHKEIVDRYKSLENDQDFIREKTARNEREIGNIKRQLS